MDHGGLSEARNWRTSLFFLRGRLLSRKARGKHGGEKRKTSWRVSFTVFPSPRNSCVGEVSCLSWHGRQNKHLQKCSRSDFHGGGVWGGGEGKGGGGSSVTCTLRRTSTYIHT